jgi:hypothetical protein
MNIDSVDASTGRGNDLVFYIVQGEGLMARITTRIDPLDKDIALILAQDLSPAARSKAFGAYAREVIAETDAHNDSAVGRDVTYETFVDGARSDALENAKSVIVAEWDLLTDSFEWIEEQLILHSPRGPDINGHYGEEHVFLADGAKADPARPPPDMEEGIFVNAKPYARKLEKLYAVYETVAALAASRFGKSARVRYTFATYAGQRQPAISIRPR